MSGSGFSFPPPPPPPPPPLQSDHAGSFQSRIYDDRQRGNSGYGNGRGQGVWDGRGRNRGGYLHPHPNRGGPTLRSQQQQRFPTGNRHTSSPNSLYQQQDTRSPLPITLASGTYADPDRATSNRQFSPTSSHVTPVSMAASLPRTAAGHKRKLEALRPPPHERVPKSQAAPATPSFGPPLLPAKPVKPRPAEAKVKTKPASNGLGLVPSSEDPQYSSSDDGDNEDIDEEAMHAELGAKLSFEHNGTVISLSSTAEIAAWQEERRRNWPTRARMTEREGERRRVGEERRRLLAMPPLPNSRWSVDFTTKKDDDRLHDRRQLDSITNEAITNEDSKFVTAKRQLAEREAELEDLRRRVADGQARIDMSQSRLVRHEGGGANPSSIPKPLVGYADDDDEDNPGVEPEHGASDTSSEVLSESSEISSASSTENVPDNDELPEETTSKLIDTSDAEFRKPVCKYFAASGHCRDGDACRFRHARTQGPQLTRGRTNPAQPPAAQRRAAVIETNGRKGIFQRLLEQQQEGEDRLALEVIKYLGKAGFFRDVSTETAVTPQ
ncbi:hypothetical protein BAUCODRAFT_150603 [Baudoinia panamericana UAMH 10762]|uniref:C3H1-type domain-containing protein n=1 Tax=Baudoinia panamericana (strain UAMH 10762) TaxID=717646 RepID=M2LGM6_BAUPA|nr:uncharacterized protein BAUCODRAFT_150603 [Baudoinia panamericana UAMH 10762]EMC93247.1 hypothetical protein BAUCODRAFT_150603 [Baudoinia panamericana UAMH 10762]